MRDVGGRMKNKQEYLIKRLMVAERLRKYRVL